MKAINWLMNSRNWAGMDSRSLFVPQKYVILSQWVSLISARRWYLSTKRKYNIIGWVKCFWCFIHSLKRRSSLLDIPISSFRFSHGLYQFHKDTIIQSTDNVFFSHLHDITPISIWVSIVFWFLQNINNSTVYDYLSWTDRRWTWVKLRVCLK